MSTSLDKPTVLVIDDSETITCLVSSFLEPAGYAVVTANCGADGLNAVNTIRPAAVICDFKMPGMSGLAVLDRLRRNAVTRDVPFILLVSGLEQLPHQSPNQPCDIIEKPFRPSRLVETLVRVTGTGNSPW
jgi:CheY-like chemotaxis protein